MIFNYLSALVITPMSFNIMDFMLYAIVGNICYYGYTRVSNSINMALSFVYLNTYNLQKIGTEFEKLNTNAIKRLEPIGTELHKLNHKIDSISDSVSNYTTNDTIMQYFKMFGIDNIVNNMLSSLFTGSKSSNQETNLYSEFDNNRIKTIPSLDKSNVYEQSLNENALIGAILDSLSKMPVSKPATKSDTKPDTKIPNENAIIDAILESLSKIPVSKPTTKLDTNPLNPYSVNLEFANNNESSCPTLDSLSSSSSSIDSNDTIDKTYDNIVNGVN